MKRKNTIFIKSGIDISNARSMWNFLKNHFTYYTLNSWNELKSIANNVKIYNLKLDLDRQDTLDLLIEDPDKLYEWSEVFQAYIDKFEEEHPGYMIRANGRSDGYLVMYKVKDNKWISFTSILPDFIIDYDNWDEFKLSCQEDQVSVKEYLPELRRYTKLVRDFDRLCEDLRLEFNDFLSSLSLESQINTALSDSKNINIIKVSII